VHRDALDPDELSAVGTHDESGALIRMPGWGQLRPCRRKDHRRLRLTWCVRLLVPSPSSELWTTATMPPATCWI